MGVLSYFQAAATDKKIEQLDAAANSSLKYLRDSGSYLGDEEVERATWLKDWYLRLKEKYKYDRKQLLQITQDWRDYVDCQTTTLEVAFGGMGGGDADGILENMIAESSASTYEIENRFASLLGPDAETWLKNHRSQNE